MALLLSRVFTLLLVVFILGGCRAITGHGDSLHSFDKILKYPTCDYYFVQKMIEDEDDVILWASQGGSLGRNCFDYSRSNLFFDKAENLYKSSVDLKSGIAQARSSLGSVFINRNVNDYIGNVYEKVMINTYKGLNFMALGDFVNARIEFNRAIDRQRRAKEYFEAQIEEVREENSRDKNYRKAQNKYTQKAIHDEFRDIFSGFEAYPDFINPFTTYISGIFFLLDRDYARARDLLKRSVAMQPKNRQIRADFELADRLSGFYEKEKNYLWIIYESGQSMAKKEIRIDIPLFIFTDKVHYAGLALPKLYARASSYDFVQVEDKQSEMIADMDSIMKVEFEKRFSLISLEATLSLIAKTYIQYELHKSSPVGGFLGALYQGLTNRADVRSWTALPKNFQSLRVELNENPVIIRDDKGRVISVVEVETDRDALVYIKSSSRGDIRVHRVIRRR